MRVSQLFFVSPKDLAAFEPKGGWDLLSSRSGVERAPFLYVVYASVYH